MKKQVKGVSKVTAKSTKKQAKQVKGVTKFTGRKATFKLEIVKGERQFRAVNRRAHTVCEKGGKRNILPETSLKNLVGKGSYTFWQYVTGKDKTLTLQPIKF